MEGGNGEENGEDSRRDGDEERMIVMVGKISVCKAMSRERT